MFTHHRAVRAGLATLACAAALTVGAGPAVADVTLPPPSATPIDASAGSGSFGIPIPTGSSQLLFPPAPPGSCQRVC